MRAALAHVADTLEAYAKLSLHTPGTLPENPAKQAQLAVQLRENLQYENLDLSLLWKLRPSPFEVMLDNLMSNAETGKVRAWPPLPLPALFDPLLADAYVQRYLERTIGECVTAGTMLEYKYVSHSIIRARALPLFPYPSSLAGVEEHVRQRCIRPCPRPTCSA